MTDNPKCETCRFWLRGDPGGCYRYPPQGDDVFVRADAWCGEHQPRQPAEAEAPKTAADAGLRAALVGLLEWCEAAQITVEPRLTPADTFDFRAAMKRARAALAKLDGGDHD